jgi:hypothetical protein
MTAVQHAFVDAGCAGIGRCNVWSPEPQEGRRQSRQTAALGAPVARRTGVVSEPLTGMRRPRAMGHKLGCSSLTPSGSALDVPLRCAMEAHVQFAPVQILFIRENAVKLRDSIFAPEHFHKSGLDVLSRTGILVAFRIGIGDVRGDGVEKLGDRAKASLANGSQRANSSSNVQPRPIAFAAQAGANCSRPRHAHAQRSADSASGHGWDSSRTIASDHSFGISLSQDVAVAKRAEHSPLRCSICSICTKCRVARPF